MSLQSAIGCLSTVSYCDVFRHSDTATSARLLWDGTHPENSMPCSPLKAKRRFGGTYRLHLLGRRRRLATCFLLDLLFDLRFRFLPADYTALHPRRQNYSSVHIQFLCSMLREMMVTVHKRGILST
jgi:hypothetical protein